MKKRYLKTPKEVIALKDTDTKIYVDDESGYYKFVNGVLCAFDDEDNSWSICSTLYGPAKIYIIEEEPMQEASESDVGKLCKFWDEDVNDFRISILGSIEIANQTDYPFKDDCNCEWIHCRRLLPSEVAEITGYKVEEKE